MQVTQSSYEGIYFLALFCIHMSMKLSSMTGVSSGKAHDAASEAALETDFDKLKALSVVRAKNGDTVPLVSVFQVTSCGTVTC